jgi:heme oxygenase
MALAKKISEGEAGEFDIFFEDKNDECRERLFWEFNSLSVVYQKPSERFLKDTVLKQTMASEKKYFPERVRKIKTEEVDDGEEPSEAQFTPLIQSAGVVKVT